MNNHHFKTSIIGCGSVGATTAYSYLLSGTVTDLVVYDLDYKKARGLVLDLEHSLSFTPNTSVTAAKKLSECSHSSLIVITAGGRQKEGETRLDLINQNREIFKDLIPQLAQDSPEAIFLIVTNPVDILTYQAIKLAKLPEGRVFGSGTLLDSARLQFHLSQRIGIHPSSIDAYILGEHGDTSFPVYSSANVLGKPLNTFPNFTEKTAQEAYQDTQEAAYRIINDQGYTCYSIATAIRQITDAIFEDKKQVLPLSTMLSDYHGHSDVCLSVPCVLGRHGIEAQLQTPLNKQEKQDLKKSVQTLKSHLQ